jgi:hypothetical protein
VANVLANLGPCDGVMGSDNGTWVDRVERRALSAKAETAVGSLHGRLAESFSAVPLAGIAAVLAGGRLPARGEGGPPVNRFVQLITDYGGSVVGARVARMAERRPLTP